MFVLAAVAAGNESLTRGVAALLPPAASAVASSWLFHVVTWETTWHNVTDADSNCTRLGMGMGVCVGVDVCVGVCVGVGMRGHVAAYVCVPSRGRVCASACACGEHYNCTFFTPT